MAMPWESFRELHAIWLSEADSSVERYLVRPFRIWFRVDGMSKTIDYFPHLERRLSNNRWEVIEVERSQDEVSREPHYERKLARARQLADVEGFDFRVMTKEEHLTAPAIKNAETIVRDRFTQVTTADVEAFVTAAERGGTMPLAKAIEALSCHGNCFDPTARAKLHALIVRRVAGVNIGRPFPDIKHKWDAWGRPRQLLVDHGWEFTSPSFQDAMHDLGTDIIWAPVRAPHYKAVGERFFGPLNMKLFHRVKGGVPYDPRRMRLARLNPRAEAVITLNDLDELMHQLIIDGYHRDPHEGLNDDIPARLWREKLIFHKRPWIRDIKALNALLGRTTTATLTTSGIQFSNLRFHDKHVVAVLLRELVRYEAK
jgi:transposase InsO family protein